MKKALIASVMMASSLVMGVAHADTYTLDPNHAAVRFSIDHFGTSTNHGAFYSLTGQLNYAPANKMGDITVTIPMDKLDTGIPAFTEHLKSADFFNATQYPTAQFKSTKWHFRGDKVTKVDGILTMLGQSHPVTLKATKFNCYDNKMMNTRACGGDFETTIDRTKWGMNTYVNMGFAKNVKLNIQIEALKK